MDDEKLIDFHNSCVFAITVCDRFAIANFCATAARAFGRVPGCAMITFSLYLVAFYMLRLSFLSRVAIICNVCLLLALVMRYYSFVSSHDLQSTILVAGLVLSVVINGIVNIIYAVLLIKKSKLGTYVPIWLATINFLFLIFQFYLILAR